MLWFVGCVFVLGCIDVDEICSCCYGWFFDVIVEIYMFLLVD